MIRWKTVPSAKRYEVSENGEVRTWAKKGPGRRLMDAPKEMSVQIRKDGYVRASIRRDDGTVGAYVHRLVLESFVGPCPEGRECRHLNGIRDDNRLCNLAWGTPSENSADRERHGSLNPPVGERCGSAKLREFDVIEIRRLYGGGMSQRAIARKFGVMQSAISKIVLRQRWKHI